MKKTAFTLIELLVVIVIIGILATISVAQFNEYQEKARFAKAQAFASQIDTVLMAETMATGYGFPLRLDFDEGSGTVAKDTSGSGNDLDNWSAVTGISRTDDTPDNSVGALLIDGVGITARNIKNMPASEVSFSVFFRLDQFPSGPYTFPVFISNNSGFRLGNNGSVTFYMNSRDPNESDISSEPNTIKLGKWHHLLGSYKNGVMRFFVDGELIAQEENIPLSVPFNTNTYGTSNLVIWLGYGGTAHEFNGAIDRVRIYPVGLDPSNL